MSSDYDAGSEYANLGLSTELHERLTAALEWYTDANAAYDHDRVVRAGLIEGEIRTRVNAADGSAEETVTDILNRHGA